MLDITLRQLESFAATVEYRSFTRAAESLYLTQSTVSAHIAALEQTLGVPLLLRGARRQLILTEEGRRVYTATLDILERCGALQALSVPPGGETLLIGASTVPGQYILFVGAALDRKRFSYHAVAEDRLVLATADQERFRAEQQESTDALELLLREPVLARESGSGTERALEQYLSGRGVAPESLRVTARIDSPEVLKSAVMQGLGVAVLSELAVRQEAADGRLLVFEPHQGAITRRIYMALRRDAALSRGERDFAAYVKETTRGKYHR